uniref:Arrestin C-terminal-like domain-containing protein n=1 Tax=Kalmanozyma brasiliensis (strain GHG001) TaxID=1365824 RepID=V5GGW0_KALBG
MVTKHPKVKIDVILSSNVFEAGGAITGKVELTCTTGQRLRLGHIAVELEAVEQLTSRDHAATQLFLYNRTLFQGEKLPPSNAVLPAAPVNGYWTARKGRTSFPFSFRLPSSAPSCVKFAGNASLRYGLKATVQTWYNEDKMVVTARREAFVLEKWADQLHPRFREPAEAVADTRLFMGGNGAVWLEAGVSEQLFWGGGQMLIRCGIKNSTKRHLSGIKVSLARRLIFPVGSAEGFHDSPDKLSLEPRITEIVHERTFKGREYEFDPNAESVCTVAVDVPKDLRTIRKTRLFEVRIFAFVSLLLGSFAKDLTIEIPVYVAHTASGQPPAQQGLDSLHAGPPSHSPPMPPFAGGGGAPSITGLATIEEDSESQAGTIKTLAKLPTIGKTGKGGKGNSVSRNNIEQFEAMAEAEEDEEEVKRQMIAMGMQPDEDAFASKEQDRSSDARAEASDSTPKASTSRRADGTQASSSGTYRLKASDIFQHAGSADVPSSQAAEPARDLAEPTTAELGHSHDSYDSMQSNQARERRSSTASSVVSLRRSSSSQGIGLQALESNLVRTTTPKICTNSRPLVTMANVARAESVPSPLAAAPAVFDDSTRSRKNSALRAAALAREEAERKSAEEQARAAEERARQVQAEQARQAAAAEEEAARKQAARIRAEEQQRLERERIAEHARRQRELREQEEEQRLKAEAERVAREEEAKRQEREEMERQERQAAEAARARAVADDTKELRRLAYSASDRMERIKAAIANAPKSVAPSVPSKMTAPVLAAPSRTSDQDRVVLKQQAVQRVDGWLSNPTSPNTSHMNTPGTPSASVLSVMRKEEPSASAAGAGEGRSSYAYSSPSQVIDPMWEAKPPRSEKVEVAMPKSHTMADLASSKASAAVAPARNSIDEPIPQLSAELRALVDGSDIRPARKSGTALKEHPISRRLSGLGSTNKASAVVVPGPSFTHVSSQASRERHTSMPSWPRPGLPAGSNASAVPFVTATPSESSSSRGTERRASRNHETLEVGIPTRVEKTLMAPNFDSQRNKDEHSYDIRSARGGRGGRVTSVAQLWSKIAGDDDDAASDVSRNSLAAPSADGEPRSASPSNTSTFRPKPRRSSSASNSAPALDFSKKAMSSPTTSTGVTAIAATFAGEVDSNKPESLKSFTAPQFLNTSVPKAVFSASTDAASKPEKRPLPKPVLQPGAVPAPQLVRPTAMRAQKPERTSSRRISTQLLSTFEKDKVAQREMSVEEMMSKVSVDSTILGALNYDGSHDVSTWRCNNGTEIKMSGRGTTKAIGENKLKSLRAVWGS